MALSVFDGNASKVTQALKEHYKPLTIKSMVYQHNPLLALMPKYEAFGGENMPIPLILTGPQRRSATFTSGQGNSSTSSVKQFLITRARDYSFASIEHEAIKASQNNADAFIRYATMEIDGAIHSLKRSLATSMYRDGTGSIGAINSSNPADGATSFTLATPADSVNFEVGMEIVFAANTASALRAGGSVTVTAVNRVSGEISCDALNDAVAASDLIFQLGDYTAADDVLKIRGLEAWVPQDASTVTASATKTLFGVDRSVDVTRLGGVRFDGSALPIEEALIEGASLVAREGGAPDHIFTDFATYASLEKALGSKVQYDTVKSSEVDVGFDVIKMHGPRGTMKIIPDHNCPANRAFLLQLDTWSFNSLGPAPQILDLDGNRMLRESGADAYEVRVGYYGNVACNAPGYNCQVKLG